MIEYQYIKNYELEIACRKKGLDWRSSRNDMIASLKAYYATQGAEDTEAQNAEDIRMKPDNDEDYTNYFGTQLQDECDRRSLMSEDEPMKRKFELVRMLVKSDERAIRTLRKTFDPSDDEDGIKLRNFEETMTLFLIRLNETQGQNDVEEAQRMQRVNRKTILEKHEKRIRDAERQIRARSQQRHEQNSHDSSTPLGNVSPRSSVTLKDEKSSSYGSVTFSDEERTYNSNESKALQYHNVPFENVTEAPDAHSNLIEEENVRPQLAGQCYVFLAGPIRGELVESVQKLDPVSQPLEVRVDRTGYYAIFGKSTAKNRKRAARWCAKFNGAFSDAMKVNLHMEVFTTKRQEFFSKNVKQVENDAIAEVETSALEQTLRKRKAESVLESRRKRQAVDTEETKSSGLEDMASLSIAHSSPTIKRQCIEIAPKSVEHCTQEEAIAANCNTKERNISKKKPVNLYNDNNDGNQEPNGMECDSLEKIEDKHKDTEEEPFDRHASSRDTKSKPQAHHEYFGEREYDGEEVVMDLSARYIKRKLFDTPYVVLTRWHKKLKTKRGNPKVVKPEKPTVDFLFEKVRWYSKRRVLVDKEGHIYISFQDSERGERNAENWAKFGESTIQINNRGVWTGWLDSQEIYVTLEHFPTSRWIGPQY